MTRPLSALLALALVSCGESTSSPAPAPVRGWSSAGLESPDRGEGDAFWFRIGVSGTRLVVLGSMGDLWMSARYSAGWSKVAWSQPGTPISLLAREDSVWVGTEKPGRLYRCAVPSWTCVDLRIPAPDSALVRSMTAIKGHLLVEASVYGLKDLFLDSANRWIPWDSGLPLSAPYRLLTVGDTVWSATWENGLWYRVWGAPSWIRMPAPVKTRWSAPRDSANFPRGIAWHRGSLWVADWSGEVTEMPGGKAPYQGVRNCPGDDRKASCLRDLPINLFAATEHGGRLFVAGYFGASGHVLDDSSRQWITLEDTWCWNDYRDCGGTRTWDLAGLGDTLYAASSRFVMKIALADLPKMSPQLVTRWNWPVDTAWRDTFLHVPNPPNP